ncbi:hypothetical protein M758_5G061500 [Ceratodon purpureus]|uniref:CBS domain-containing protein n=1 Tax=Ceratodon purpureus TaxID=3225 RepID=A0A8T0HZY7_CERPU|nr:hypothetical protein KC19_5G063000 [Ceratodon purpureus]KAG0615713.1 hypothetical protein M758_5G061500 [Ceratodon purpureus]
MGHSDTSMEEQLQKLWEEQGDNVGVPEEVRRLLNSAFAKVPVSSFPQLPCGKVLEISGNASISDAVHLLAENNIFSAPVKDPRASPSDPWSVQYIGIVDYASIILWVLEQAELAAAAIATGSATAAGMGAGALGALGALVLGLTGPIAMAGVATVAVGAALAGGAAAERGVKDASSAVDSLGEDFYKLILENEPFKSTKVEEITRSYRWAPFLPVQHDDSMLTVLLLLTKFRLRSIPVVDVDQGVVKNMISQSSVVKGLSQCQGRDWFDSLAAKSIHQLGLPVMAPDQVVSVDASKLVLEAFKLMKEKGVGGLPVVAGPDHHLVGSISVRDVRFLLLKSHLFARRSHLTVLEFMKTISEVEAQTGTSPPVTCVKTDSLGKVVETLASKNLYRIYVVDETTRLMGVITLRDIIGCFVSEPPGFFDGYFGGAFKEAFDKSSE